MRNLRFPDNGKDERLIQSAIANARVPGVVFMDGSPNIAFHADHHVVAVYLNGQNLGGTPLEAAGGVLSVLFAEQVVIDHHTGAILFPDPSASIHLRPFIPEQTHVGKGSREISLTYRRPITAALLAPGSFTHLEYLPVEPWMNIHPEHVRELEEFAQSYPSSSADEIEEAFTRRGSATPDAAP